MTPTRALSLVGVAKNVAERFLNDPENGHLDFFRNAREDVGMKCERNLELASLHEAIDVPVKGGAEAGFVQERGMKKVRGFANFLQDCAHGVAQFWSRPLASISIFTAVTCWARSS